MSGIFAWIVLGLIAGGLAKLIMPGKDPGGCLVTMGIGILGAIIGGFMASLPFLGFLPSAQPVGWLPGLGSIFTATLGAIVFLLIYRVVTKK